MIPSRTIALWLPLLSLLFVLPAFGQTRPPAQLKAKEILKRSVRALGDEKALGTAGSTSFSGTTDGQGRFTLDLQAPNRVRFEITRDGSQPFALGNNGFSSWRATPTGGVVTLVDDPGKNLNVLIDVLANRNLEPALKWLAAFSHTPESLNGKECQVVEFRSVERGAAIMYFDAQTFLPVRLECGRGDDLIRFDFEDYRPVDGIREPFRIRFQDGNSLPVLLNAERVRHAPVFAANHFNTPGTSDGNIDLTALSKRLVDNLEKANSSLSNYSFTATQTIRQVNKEYVFLSKEVTKMEVYPIPMIGLNGPSTQFWPLSRLTSFNNREISRGQSRSLEEFYLRHLRTEAERRTRREEKKRLFYNPAMVAEILQKSELLNPRREMFRGHPVLVCDFRPRPGNQQKFFGTVWIDQAEEQLWRYEGWLDSDDKSFGGLVNSTKKGSINTFEQTRTAEGVWLPLQSSSDSSRSSGLLYLSPSEERSSVEWNYSDFKPFTEADFDALLKTTEEAVRNRR